MNPHIRLVNGMYECGIPGEDVVTGRGFTVVGAFEHWKVMCKWAEDSSKGIVVEGVEFPAVFASPTWC